MTKQPRVHISLLNWNGYPKTIRCLTSLYALDYPNYFITIVDNASIDGSVEKILEVFPDVEIIHATSNNGFAGGHELALKQSLADESVDLFWILNNDTVVRPDALTQLVEAYQQHGEALYSSTPLEPENDIYMVAFDEKYLTPHYKENLFVRSQPRQLDDLFPDRQPQIVSALPGSCIMLPLSVIHKHGYMDTDFFIYAEEIDYCFRMRSVGVPSIIVPTSIITHEGGGSHMHSPLLRDVFRYYRHRNEIIKARIYDGWFVFGVIAIKKLIRGLSQVAGAVTEGRPALFRASMTLRAFRDGVLNRRGKRFPPENYVHLTLG